MKNAIWTKIILSVLTAGLVLSLAGCVTPSGDPGKSPAKDPAGEQTPEPTEEPTEAPKPHGVEVYQLAPESQSLMECYVIRTANDKIIVMDGGIDGYGKTAEPYLPSAIRAILGLKEGEYFEVEAWFLSHAHLDHLYELAKILNRYDGTSNFKINNFYFDFPEAKTEWKTKGAETDYDLEELDALKEGLLKYLKATGKIDAGETDPQAAYDSVNRAVISAEAVDAGLTITVDGVDFQVLRTWSKKDLYVNSTSIVVRMVYGEHSILFLGDTYEDSGAALLKKVGAEGLRSEYVQISHHGQSGASMNFYKKIEAKTSKRLWPTPAWVWNVYKATNGIQTDTTRYWFGLPKDPAEFLAQGLDKTGSDFVAGLYAHYPNDPTAVSSWTEEVLSGQRVAVFEIPAGN